MPLTREQQLEIRSAADVSIKQLCQDQTFIKSIVDSVSAGIVQILNSKLDVYEKKIDDLKTEITKIITDHEVEIQTIKASLIDLNKKGDSFDMIKITTELNQIKRKESNILIFGVPETEIHLQAYIENMFTAISMNRNPQLNGLHVSRLGLQPSANSNKCRPIKVTFPNSNQVTNFLKLNPKLKSLDCYKNIYMRSDQTVMQREYTSKIKKELSDRLAAESWLRDGVRSSELFPEDTYTVYRKDRSFGKFGGGVIFAVNNNVCHSEQHSVVFPIEKIDVLCVKVFKTNIKPIFFITVYFPPNVTFSEYSDFFDYIETFHETHEVVLIGDFNLTDLAAYYVNNSQITPLINRFVQLLNYTDSVQCNKIKNIHGKILDLIVTPSVFSCEVTPEVNALVPIDYHHPALTCYFPYEVKEDEYFVPNQKRLNFRKYNVNKFNKLLTEMDWSHLKHFSDVDSAVDSFSLSLQEIIDKCVPLSSTRSQKYPAWFTSEIIAKVKRKHHYLRMYRRSKYCFYLQRAKDLRRTIKLEVQLEYKKFIERSQNSFKSDARQFWNFVNAKNNKSRIPGLMKYGSDKFTTSQDIVNAFANFFKSVYISDSNSSPSVTSYFNYNPSSYFNIGTAHTSSNNLILEPSQISLFIAKTGKNHTTGENLIKPSISAFHKTFLEKDDKNVKAMPLSNDTVSRRKDEMGKDTEKQLVG
ncbi:uncharacterized protein LOC126888546 [Diabrotica virgifera virgifera]|uniref:Endonuclease/exonuclease/phosphatase domain-containing protein n=1 Tax=Diabrotica virgifera virgifera TaxID=50390 RepID=A0ABM5KRN3_DIAVI|nr:uncharacterized protein LOC126888546 [Diabrotica virgifera virgifera]